MALLPDLSKIKLDFSDLSKLTSPLNLNLQPPKIEFNPPKIDVGGLLSGAEHFLSDVVKGAESTIGGIANEAEKLVSSLSPKDTSNNNAPEWMKKYAENYQKGVQNWANMVSYQNMAEQYKKEEEKEKKKTEKKKTSTTNSKSSNEQNNTNETVVSNTPSFGSREFEQVGNALKHLFGFSNSPKIPNPPNPLPNLPKLDFNINLPKGIPDILHRDSENNNSNSNKEGKNNPEINIDEKDIEKFLNSRTIDPNFVDKELFDTFYNNKNKMQKLLELNFRQTARPDLALDYKDFIKHYKTKPEFNIDRGVQAINWNKVGEQCVVGAATSAAISSAIGEAGGLAPLVGCIAGAGYELGREFFTGATGDKDVGETFGLLASLITGMAAEGLASRGLSALSKRILAKITGNELVRLSPEELVELLKLNPEMVSLRLVGRGATYVEKLGESSSGEVGRMIGQIEGVNAVRVLTKDGKVVTDISPLRARFISRFTRELAEDMGGSAENLPKSFPFDEYGELRGEAINPMREVDQVSKVKSINKIDVETADIGLGKTNVRELEQEFGAEGVEHLKGKEYEIEANKPFTAEYSGKSKLPEALRSKYFKEKILGNAQETEVGENNARLTIKVESPIKELANNNGLTTELVLKDKDKTLELMKSGKNFFGFSGYANTKQSILYPDMNIRALANAMQSDKDILNSLFTFRLMPSRRFIQDRIKNFLEFANRMPSGSTEVSEEVASSLLDNYGKEGSGKFVRLVPEGEKPPISPEGKVITKSSISPIEVESQARIGSFANYGTNKEMETLGSVQLVGKIWNKLYGTRKPLGSFNVHLWEFDPTLAEEMTMQQYQLPFGDANTLYSEIMSRVSLGGLASKISDAIAKNVEISNSIASESMGGIAGGVVSSRINSSPTPTQNGLSNAPTPMNNNINKPTTSNKPPLSKPLPSHEETNASETNNNTSTESEVGPDSTTETQSQTETSANTSNQTQQLQKTDTQTQNETNSQTQTNTQNNIAPTLINPPGLLEMLEISPISLLNRDTTTSTQPQEDVAEAELTGTNLEVNYKAKDIPEITPPTLPPIPPIIFYPNIEQEPKKPPKINPVILMMLRRKRRKEMKKYISQLMAEATTINMINLASLLGLR